MSNFSINEGSVSAVRQEKITYKDKDGKEHTITETTIKPSKSGAMAGAAAGAAIFGPVGFVAGGIAGWIFGPAD